MSDKIILGELEKVLFPERYPYYDTYLLKEEALLSRGTLPDLSFQNICFKLKATKYSLKIKDEDSRMMLSYIFEKHVESYYDWEKEYDWYELKSILFYFLVFSRTKSSKEIFKLLKNKHLQQNFKKYLPVEKLCSLNIHGNPNSAIGLPTL